MSFFNKKEEVLQLKLTQYGKHLLSRGQFIPKYYAFFDDTVIYDSQYAGFEESQNKVEPRIQQDTPASKVQHIFSGAETNIKKLTSNITTQLEYWEKSLPYPQNTADRHYSFNSTPLGTSNLGIEEAPAFNINFLINEMSSSYQYATGSHQILNIPQLNVDVGYETAISYTTGDITGSAFRGIGGLELGTSFEDGTSIIVTEDHILLEIEENNSPYSNKNFSIEVFLIEEEEAINIKTPGISKPTTKENLIPLSFMHLKPKIVDNILVDEDIAFPSEIDIDPSYVEYFLDIVTDGGIDPDIICSVMTKDKLEILYDEFEFECKDSDEISDNKYSAFNANVEACD
jgi:hypothetical protein